MFYNLKGNLINIKNVRNARISLLTDIRIEFNCGKQDLLTVTFSTPEEAQEAFNDFIEYAMLMGK